MVSYPVYKWLHIIGLVSVFIGLAAVWGLSAAGSTQIHKYKRTLALVHGIGLATTLVSGFGLIARLGLHSFPIWIYVKILIWFVLGGSLALAKRKTQWGSKLIFSWVALIAAAAYLALFKPF